MLSGGATTYLKVGAQTNLVELLLQFLLEPLILHRNLHMPQSMRDMSRGVRSTYPGQRKGKCTSNHG